MKIKMTVLMERVEDHESPGDVSEDMDTLLEMVKEAVDSCGCKHVQTKFELANKIKGKP